MRYTTMSKQMTRILLLLLPLVVVACAWICPTTTSTLSSCSSFRRRPYSSCSSSQLLMALVNKKDNAMVNFRNQSPAVMRENYSPLDENVLDKVYTIVKAADGKKAQDIVALNVEACTFLCSSIVILTGNSRPQNQALVKAIQEDMHDASSSSDNNHHHPLRQVLPEGTADSGWMLLDYGSVMVHIMTPKSRLYYNIQGQWMEKGGTLIPLQHILLPNTATSDGTMEQQQEDNVLSPPRQDDPFWS